MRVVCLIQRRRERTHTHVCVCVVCVREFMLSIVPHVKCSHISNCKAVARMDIRHRYGFLGKSVIFHYILLHLSACFAGIVVRKTVADNGGFAVAAEHACDNIDK